MKYELIFAGGTGSRMRGSTKPKQFLELNGKPIIIHTIEHFDYHSEIDEIFVVCHSDWIKYLKEKLNRFHIKKVKSIVPGGNTGQESIRNGLFAIRDSLKNDDDKAIVLIHDGVRPLIDEKTITDNIESVRNFGNAITIAPAIETIIETDDESEITKIHDRSHCQLARAPQSFYLKDILEAHYKSIENNESEMIDSATMMYHYGNELHTVEGPVENIKITTPMDYYLFRAIVEARENEQIGSLNN